MIKYSVVSDKGKTRKDNEDSYYAHGNLFMVADGMGGHNAGDVASKLAVKTIGDLSKQAVQTANEEKLIEEFFKEANRAVLKRSGKIASEQGMGTTLTLLLIKDEKAYLGHIGDSRAYILRDGKLLQVTDDHSLVANMVDEGKITEEEARIHPYRNVITKALGSEEKIEPDVFSVDIKKGDRILMCSDGLTSMVDDDRILDVLKKSETLRGAATALVKIANENGGSDNITALVIDVIEGKKRSFWPIAISLTVAFVILCAGLFFGAKMVISGYYYVGYSGENVAVYQGVPYSIVNYDLSKAIYVSSLKKKKLASVWQERIFKTISVKSISQGKNSIKQIAKENVTKKS